MRPHHPLQTSSFRRKKRQLHHLLDRLEQWQISGKWSQMPHDSRKRLRLRLYHLLRTLPHYLIPAKFRRLLTGLVLCLAPFSKSLGQSAPNFLPPVTNPFSLAPYPSDFYAPKAVDIDGDGDIDLVTIESNGDVKFFENTGGATNPSFAAPVLNSFGIPNLDHIGLIDFADLDADGDFDLLGVGYMAQFDYYENTGSATNPQFGPVVAAPFGLDTLRYRTQPNFADFDDDGDQDLMLYQWPRDWYYLENTGTANAPLFAPPVLSPFGVTSAPANYYDVVCVGDLDLDGDVDLFTSTYTGPYRYFENLGSPTAPAFSTPLFSPFGLPNASPLSFPLIADLDGDSDMDILSFDYNASDWIYYENSPLVALEPSDAQDLQLKVFPNPSAGSVQVQWQTEAKDRLEKLSLFDLQGRLLIQSELPPGWQGSYQLDLEALPAGTYLLEVQSESGGAKRTSLNKL